jgi:hypothetical protein
MREEDINEFLTHLARAALEEVYSGNHDIAQRWCMLEEDAKYTHSSGPALIDWFCEGIDHVFWYEDFVLRWLKL